MSNKKRTISSMIFAGALSTSLFLGNTFINKQPINTEIGTAIVVKDGEIQPIMTMTEKINAFTDNGLYKIESIYGDVSYAADMAGLVGKTIPATSLKLLNGEYLDTSSFAGKAYVIEVVASWCEYCQETSKEYLGDIVAKHTDLEFVQIFAEGNTGDVNTFYEEISKNPEDMGYVVPADNTSIDFVNKLNLTGYPTWVFVDESGKISWVHSGYITGEEFSTLRNAAYTGTKIYDCLVEDFDDTRTGITVNNIGDALSVEALSAIAKIETEGQYMVYSNLNRKFNGFKAKDSNGNDIDLSTLAGEKIYLEINVADTSFTGTIENARNNAAIQELAEEKGITTVQVWLAYYTEGNAFTGDAFRKANGLEAVYDYVFDGEEENMIDTIYEFDIYSAPSQLYINEDGRVVGATIGEIDTDKFEEATKLYYGETPLYKQVADGAEKTLNTASKEQDFEDKVVNIAFPVSLIITLVSFVSLLSSKKKTKVEDIIEEVETTEEQKETSR